MFPANFKSYFKLCLSFIFKREENEFIVWPVIKSVIILKCVLNAKLVLQFLFFFSDFHFLTRIVFYNAQTAIQLENKCF